MSDSVVSKLVASNLRKKYKARTVVTDVSFEVKSGEVVGLLGPNGAGKTTCFYMIVGLAPADGGEVHIDDARLTHLPMHSRARQGLSYLPPRRRPLRTPDRWTSPAPKQRLPPPRRCALWVWTSWTCRTWNCRTWNCP